MPNGLPKSLPRSMTAIAIREPGGPDVLVPQQLLVPSPGEGEILVKVAAAGVNRPDVMRRHGDGARGRRRLRRILSGFRKSRAAGAGKSVDDRGRGDSGNLLHGLAQCVRARQARRRRNAARSRRLVRNRHHGNSARQGVRRPCHRHRRHRGKMRCLPQARRRSRHQLQHRRLRRAQQASDPRPRCRADPGYGRRRLCRPQL